MSVSPHAPELAPPTAPPAGHELDESQFAHYTGQMDDYLSALESWLAALEQMPPETRLEENLKTEKGNLSSANSLNGEQRREIAAALSRLVAASEALAHPPAETSPAPKMRRPRSGLTSI